MTLGLLLAATKVDQGVFAASAVIVLSGAIGVVISSNPVHAALSLVMTLFGIAVLFVAQEAHFLAAVQVIVYAGAIVVLFLFVIMLIGVDRAEDIRREPLRGQRPLAVLLGLVALAEIVLLSRGGDWVTGASAVAGQASGEGTNVEKLAESIFTRYMFAFEATSVLLIIAVVGAVVLVRRPPPVAEGDDEGEPVSAVTNVPGAPADAGAEAAR